MAETLCWKCRKATNPKGSDCEWAKNFTPVKGWDAVLVKLKYATVNCSSSYRVIDCPKFERG